MANPLSEAEERLQKLLEWQEKEVLRCGRRIIPALTPEDMLQPNDYPELENNPHFRYEEGVLSGILSALTAIRSPKFSDLALEAAD